MVPARCGVTITQGVGLGPRTLQEPAVHDCESIAALLRKGHWFRNLPPELQSLIVTHATVHRHRKGESILREGQPAKGLFVVLDGCVRIVRSVDDSAEVLLAVAESGFWFGDYSTFMGGAPSITSIIAKSPMRTLFLSASAFERIIEDEPRYFR
jgi:CRP-like cAMP-binding protein